MVRKIRQRLRSEDGSALVLALAFLAFFSVVVAALLGFADTSFRVSRVLDERNDSVYAADGALDGAIEALRYSTNGRASGSCPTFGPMAVNGASVTVECSANPDAGLPIGGDDNPSNKPEFALLTLGSSDPNEGIVTPNSSGQSVMRVKGKTHSNSIIRTGTNSSLIVDGDVTATGVCSSGVTVVAPATKTCSTGATEPDPGEGKSAPGEKFGPLVARSAIPTRTVPACTGNVVSVQPGFYNSATALETLTNAGSCANKVIWFQPGVYYFEFSATSDHRWDLDRATNKFIGGTRSGWSLSTPVADVPFPNACDPSEDGVQFVFGGDSRMRLTAGDFEICAQPASDKQQIAIYGVRDATAIVGPTTLASTTASDVAGFVDADPKALTLNDVTSDATLASTSSGSSATLKLSGYTQAIPAGSTITKALLKVRHRETAGADRDIASLVARVTPAGASSATTFNVPVNRTTSLVTNEIDVTSLLDQPSELAGVSVVYAVTMDRNKAGTARLDGIQLEVTYAAPGFAQQSGCIANAVYDNQNACPILDADGANSNLVIHGTVYAPLAAVRLNLPNQSLQVIDRGAIVRAALVGLPSVAPAVPAFQLPDDSSGLFSNRQVLFAVKIDGVTRLRSLVTYTDCTTPCVANEPGRAVIVESWSVLR